MTPEHFQLLSPRSLDAVARNAEASAPGASDDEVTKRRALSRIARYEITRRRAEVPVRDRYTCCDGA